MTLDKQNFSSKKEHEFTVDWFGHNAPAWKNILDQLCPKKILEIGSYEGKSTCYLIDQMSNLQESEIHCIDTWEGSAEHNGINMSDVETRFRQNINVSLESAKFKSDIKIHKGKSKDILISFLSNKMHDYFDFIYVDGSHEAPDVLMDAILSFSLLRTNGIIVFDDYLWKGYDDPRRCPKMAIDAFVDVFSKHLNIIRWMPLYQLYVQKI